MPLTVSGRLAGSEDFSGGECGVEGLGEAAVDGGVHKGFDNLVAGDADVEGGADVDLELGFAAAEGGQDAEGDQLAAPRVQAKAGRRCRRRRMRRRGGPGRG